jgi:hypothetical protein
MEPRTALGSEVQSLRTGLVEAYRRAVQGRQACRVSMWERSKVAKQQEVVAAEVEGERLEGGRLEAGERLEVGERMEVGQRMEVGELVELQMVVQVGAKKKAAEQNPCWVSERGPRYPSVTSSVTAQPQSGLPACHHD